MTYSSHEPLETLDWLWSDDEVFSLIDKLEDLIDKYEDYYTDLRISVREIATQRGLMQQVLVMGIPISEESNVR